MRTAWKILWMSAAAILALGVLLFVVAFAVNFQDEPISAGAAALAAGPVNRVPDADNLYLAMAGADAPVGQDVIAYGLLRIAAFNARVAALEADPALLAMGASNADAPEQIQFKGKLPICGQVDLQCWRESVTHQLELLALWEDNRMLMARYMAMQQLGGYHDTARLDFMAGFPPLHFGKQQHFLLLADVARRLQTAPQPERRAAYESLLGEVGVWRHVLAGDGSLISTMVALAYAQRAEMLLAFMVADPTVPVEQLTGDELDLPPLWAPGTSPLGWAFECEFRATVPLWNEFRDPRYSDAVVDAESDGGPRWWRRGKQRLVNHFVRPNASENLQAELFLESGRAAAAPPAGLREAQGKFEDWRATHLGLANARMLFNPAGKTLVAIGTPHFMDYVLRAWDVAAFERMVRLGFEIRRQHILAKDVPGFMKAHPKLSTHPVDGREFSWDDRSHTLTVQVLGKHSSSLNFTMPVWQPNR